MTKRINTAHINSLIAPTVDAGTRKDVLFLPWPPSVNHYWRHSMGRVMISREGRQYRGRVMDAVSSQGLGVFNAFGSKMRLRVAIRAYAPDKRRRDVDNLPKAILDALMHAGVYGDDSQIDELSIVRGAPGAGIVSVIIEPIVRVL